MTSSATNSGAVPTTHARGRAPATAPHWRWPSGRVRVGLVAATTAAVAGSLLGLAAPARAACDGPRLLSMADAEVYEGTGPGTTNLVFKVTSAGCSPASSVEYTTNWEGLSSAVAPDDYAATIATLTWFAGDATPRYVTVTVVRDADDEPNEHFWAYLHSATGSTELADAWASGHILDDDGPVKWNVGSAACTEGNPARSATSTPCAVTITVSKSSPVPMTVAVSTADKTAMDPHDYQKLSGVTVTMPASARMASATVMLTRDWLCEGDETLSLKITAPSHGVIAGGIALVTIVDDDGSC